MDAFEELMLSGKLNLSDRELRIFEEFVTTRDKLEKENIKHTIVIFGTARTKDNDTNPISRHYYQCNYELSKKLATWVKTKYVSRPPQDKYYICTGGGGGAMEAANRGASDAGERTLGFNIKLPFEQFTNPYVSQDLIFHFHYFFIRKFFFANLAKAFIIFPGGFGTMDELFEIMTLSQTHKMQKTIPFVLFGKEFFGQFLNFDMLIEHGYISPQDKNLYILTDSVDEAYQHIINNIEKDKFLI
ncbi:MAG: TIGR00730 family Rossman fold protein [Firmicutes bacterium]|nr:TIGR00730 family Rossman fold protein [Bacillota bacterium]MCL1954137.1 TIGR00730 family Rossman fold protein [Bacillota bacterium]